MVICCPRTPIATTKFIFACQFGFFTQSLINVQYGINVMEEVFKKLISETYGISVMERIFLKNNMSKLSIATEFYSKTGTYLS